MAGLDRGASRRTHSVLIAKQWSNDFVSQRNHVLVKLDSNTVNSKPIIDLSCPHHVLIVKPKTKLYKVGFKGVRNK